jgi:PST family polysaccharide transporter
VTPGEGAEPTSTATLQAAPEGDLKASAASGVKWSLIGTIVSQGARLLTSFVLARVLGPDRYGVVAIAYVYLSLATVLIDQAFGLLVIQRPTLDRTELGTATAVNATGVALLAGLTLWIAPLVAEYFHEPRVGPVIRVLAIDLVFRGLAAIPLGLLARRLGFKAIAVIQLLATVVACVAAVGAGFAGAGYWALVVQALVQDGFILIGAILMAGIPVLAMSRRGLRGMIAFSGALMLAQLLDFLGLNVDSLLIGRRLGAEELAFYGLAYRLMLLLLDVITGVISRVALPTLARAQDDPDRMQRGFLLSVRASTIGSFAAFSTAALTLPTLIPWLLGESWRPAVVPLVLLLAAACFRVILYMWGPLATAQGRTDLVLLWTFIVVSTTVVGFLVGIEWGINGVAASYVVSSGILVLPNAFHVGRQVGIRLSAFLAAIAPAAVALSVQGVVWLVVSQGASHLALTSAGAELTAAAIGIVSYAAVVRYAWPEVFKEMLSMGQMIVGRGAAVDIAEPLLIEDPV